MAECVLVPVDGQPGADRTIEVRKQTREEGEEHEMDCYTFSSKLFSQSMLQFALTPITWTQTNKQAFLVFQLRGTNSSLLSFFVNNNMFIQ